MLNTATMHSSIGPATQQAEAGPGQLRPLLVPIPEGQRQFGGIGKTLFYEVVEKHNIRLVRLGGRSMVPVSEIERVVAELMAASPAEPPAKVAAATAASLAARQATPSRRRKLGAAPP